MQLADMDDSQWAHACELAKQELREDERSALLRVAAGTATHADAAFLANSLGHRDLFAHYASDTHATPIEEDAE
jgi:hypothetical protein